MSIRLSAYLFQQSKRSEPDLKGWYLVSGGRALLSYSKTPTPWMGQIPLILSLQCSGIFSPSLPHFFNHQFLFLGARQQKCVMHTFPLVRTVAFLLRVSFLS